MRKNIYALMFLVGCQIAQPSAPRGVPTFTLEDLLVYTVALGVAV